MSDEAKTIAEIEERHEYVCRQDHASAELFDLAQYGREAHDHRATLLAIVKRQQEREAVLREAAEGGCVALDECADILRCTFPSLADHVIGPVAEKIRKALAGGPTNG